ncbi:MAG: PEP-CTERM sorting domain-containing protein [Armatimonadia bacterium]|nr:PEP-CTERM sorting domain-containing protein [Armatimonadia bacterium]
MRNSVVGLLTLALVLTVALPASADVTVGLDSYQYLSGSNVWEYVYEIDNTTGTEYIFSLDITSIDGATITGNPAGWTITSETGGVDGSVSWLAPSNTDWLAPGGTLSGFEIQSPYGIGGGTDFTGWIASRDFDGENGGATGPTFGETNGPHVPEPGTLLLLGCGLAAIIARRRK